ncbi:TPA: FAD-dependent oxidoreductase [Escherichia coli]|nr:FAD-dependent oxidoreductase [Escherichia coli]
MFGGAQQWGQQVYAIVQNTDQAQAVMPYGPKCIYVLEQNDALQRTENYAESIAALLKDKHPAMLLLAATKRGKALAARLSVQLNAALVNDATAVDIVDGHICAEHRMYGGLAFAQEKINSPLAIISAGVAGSVAALVMARAGLDVLVIERGDSAGCKNMTGGRLYAHTLEAIIPGFAVSAPVERKVTREKISFLTEESAVTLDFHREQPDVPQHASYTVLRNRLDPWLMEQAEQAGAQFIPGVRVDALVREGNKVTGVQAGDDILQANVVVLADGVNSMLGRSLGMVPASDPHHYAVGVKEVIGLTPEQINDRFNITGEEGAAWLFAGSPSDGLMGGGFLYTNKDSISLGLVCGLGDIAHAQKSVPQMLEDFKQHPAIRPLISGGKLLEYSAHMVPEGGLAMVPQLVNDGVMIVGDAAGFCLNLGFTVRGMDLAIASAQAAATTVIAAKEREDFSASSLAQYKRELEQSCVMRDMQHFRKIPALMENPRLFSQYPRMVADIMNEMFTIDGKPNQPVRKMIMGHAKKIGLINLLKDGIKGATAL